MCNFHLRIADTLGTLNTQHATRDLVLLLKYIDHEFDLHILCIATALASLEDKRQMVTLVKASSSNLRRFFILDFKFERWTPTWITSNSPCARTLNSNLLIHQVPWIFSFFIHLYRAAFEPCTKVAFVASKRLWHVRLNGIRFYKSRSITFIEKRFVSLSIFFTSHAVHVGVVDVQKKS